MAKTYQFGRFILNADEQTLSIDGANVHMPIKEFEILQMLVENNGRLLTKDEMMSTVWKDTFVEESNLAQYVSRLRKILNADGKQYIKTIPKRGYRFYADVTESPGEVTFERRVTVQISEKTFQRAKSLDEIGSLAVLPFRPLGHTDAEFLGLGIADALITQLTRTGSLVVTPTASVAKITDEDADFTEIGERLGVDAILQGNFQKLGQRIRLTVQMLDAGSGRPLWADSFNSEIDDIFDMQDRIAERVVDAFTRKLNSESQARLGKRYTDNSDAYQEYLKGRVHFSSRTSEGLAKALKHFQCAIEIDPQYALAYTGIADVYQLLPLSDEMEPHSAFPKAKAAALKALEFDDSLPEAHTSLGVCLMNYDWNFPGAEVSFKRAISLNPNYAAARLVYGTLLLRTGRFSDAMIELKQAQTLDPLSPVANTWMAEAFSDLGEYDTAIRLHKETLRSAPEYSLAHYYLVLSYINSGRIDEAVEAVAYATSVSDDVSLMRSANIWVKASTGKIVEAKREIDELIEAKKSRYLSATNIASGFAVLGDSEQVFKWLGVALDERDSHLTWLNSDIEFSYLRNDNRFREVLRKVNLLTASERQQLIKTGVASVDDPAVHAGQRSLRAESLSRSSKWMNAAVAALVGLILIAGAFYAFRNVGTRASRPEKNTLIRLTEFPGNEINPSFTHDGRIRFGRLTPDKNVENWVMNSDGTGMQAVAPVAGMSMGIWSPDGTKMFFLKSGGDKNLYLANSDGSDEKSMPFHPGNAQWSPDSKRFIYQAKSSDSLTNNADIFIYTLETGTIEPVVESPYFDADPIFSPDGKSILYVSDRDGNFEIYSMVLATREVTRLTNNPSHESFPTYSPDGTQITFNSDREKENNDVYLMNADGSNVRKLTDGPGWDAAPPNCWSSDGTKVVLLSDRGGKENVYLMNIEPFTPTTLFDDDSLIAMPGSFSPDGRQLAYFVSTGEHKGEIRLRTLGSGRTHVLTSVSVDTTFPLVSPDGTRILFSDVIDGNTDIWTIDIDGTNRMDLSKNPSADIAPAWSPDGTKIAFSANRGGATQLFQIYTMNSDGSDQREMFGDRAMSAGLTWSPDGKQMVFANDSEGGRIGNFELFGMNIQGGSPTRLTDRPKYDSSPAFSPDGSKIAFVSNTDGNNEIYLMNPDGTGLLRLTRDLGNDTFPQWSPDGKKIIFTSDRSGRYSIYEIVL